MRIVADDAIAFLGEAFADFGPISRVRGRAIDRAVLRDADVLLTRSVTAVDATLLAGTAVRFVGSATAGFDHVDVPGLDAAGIAFHHAPGCNAQGVVEYVVTELLSALVEWPPHRSTPIGVIGFGEIGHRLVALLRDLGLAVLVSDPPLHAKIRQGRELSLAPTHAAAARAEAFVDLPNLLGACRVVTVHVPLEVAGPWPTRHLIDAAALDALPPDGLLVNASRGEVVDGRALTRWLDDGRGQAILDVWEHEPDLDHDLVRHPNVRRATPHIAGYTLEGKARATAMIHDALARFVDREPWFDPASVVDAPAPSPAISATVDAPWLLALLATTHDLSGVDRDLRRDPSPAAFEALRRGYRLRRETSRWRRPPTPSLPPTYFPAGLHAALDRLCSP